MRVTRKNYEIGNCETGLNKTDDIQLLYSTMEALANRFEEEIRDKMRRAKKECRYNPTRFIQMLAQYGAVETAKKLIADALLTGKTSDGFTTLLLCGRLDLTMEDSVCKPEYQSLFSPEEIEYCKKVLG